MAEALSLWLPLIIDRPRFWLSSKDLPEGTRWMVELSRHLEESQFGVIIVTRDNICSPWTMFEAGALSKDLAKGRVVPYLVGLRESELFGPLAHFQAVRADRDGTLRLVTVINSVLPIPQEPRILERRFDRFWPDLETSIEKAGAWQALPDVAFGQQAENYSALRQRIDELHGLIRQLVDVWNPSANRAEQPVQPVKAEDSSAALVGAWVDRSSEVHMYIDHVNGKLAGPYCYGGNDELNAVFYDFERTGGYWFARFRWLTHQKLTGFAFLQFTSEDILEGTWQIEDNEAIGLDRAGGGKIRLERVTLEKLPDWATQFFVKLRRGETELCSP